MKLEICDEHKNKNIRFYLSRTSVECKSSSRVVFAYHQLNIFFFSTMFVLLFMDFVVSTNELINSQNKKITKWFTEQWMWRFKCVISFRFGIIMVFCAQMAFVLLEFQFWWLFVEERERETKNKDFIQSNRFIEWCNGKKTSQTTTKTPTSQR